MTHTDDAYAAMLLTLALSPNKEEYARPFGVQEFRRIEAAARASRYRAIGALMDVDISGLMMYLGLTEEEGYRAYTLLHRGVQLSYALEGYARQGIDVVTQYDAEYPRRLESKLGPSAPPCFYRCGAPNLLDGPFIAILGISGVRTTPEAKRNVEALVRAAARLGYGVITGGELGVSRQAEAMIAEGEGRLLDILGGGMREHLKEETVVRLVGEGRGAALSLEHPDAMFTTSHAVARNRLLFALADAAFVFNTDGRRGEAEALQNRTCDWIYAWEGCEGNRPLIARGARTFLALSEDGVTDLSRHWASSRAVQLDMFDML